MHVANATGSVSKKHFPLSIFSIVKFSFCFAVFSLKGFKFQNVTAGYTACKSLILYIVRATSCSKNAINVRTME